MKLLAILISLTFFTNAYSNCADDFNDGLSEYYFASKYFENGAQKHKEAVALSTSNKPNFLKICNLLVDSVTGFSVAQSSYSNCMSDFNRAISSCTGSDSTQARQNKDVCMNNEDIADDNHTVLRDLLNNTCFVTKSKLEYVELRKIQVLEY